MLEYSEGHTGVSHRHPGRYHRTPPSPLGLPQCSIAGSPHSQADQYERMAEDSWGTSEHGVWNTQRAGVALSTPACPPEGQQPPYLYSQGSPTPTPQPAAPCDRIPSTNPGADPPRDARDSGSARSHSTHLETSSSDQP